MGEFLTSSNAVFLIVMIVAIFVLYSSIAIAQENERFAVFMLGRFVHYKGPGLVLKSGTQRLVRLKVGDIGTLTSREFARFGEDDIPITNVDTMDVGDPVRIDGFDGTEPRLVKSSLRPKTLCPNCGHEFYGLAPNESLRWPAGFSHASCSGNKRALRSVASELNR